MTEEDKPVRGKSHRPLTPPSTNEYHSPAGRPRTIQILPLWTGRFPHCAQSLHPPHLYFVPAHWGETTQRLQVDLCYVSCFGPEAQQLAPWDPLDHPHSMQRLF